MTNTLSPAAAILLFLLVVGCAVPQSETRTFYEADPANGRSFNDGCSYGGFSTRSIRVLPGKREIQWSGLYVTPSPGSPNPGVSTTVIISSPNSFGLRINPRKIVLDVDGRQFRPVDVDHSITKNASRSAQFLKFKFRLGAGKNERIALLFKDGAAHTNGKAWPIAPFRATLVTKTATVSYILNC